MYLFLMKKFGKVSEEEADKLKRQYGLALRSFIDNDNNIVLNTCKDIDSKNMTIKSSDLIEIIEARIEEIFTLVNKLLIKFYILIFNIITEIIEN